MSQSQVTPWRKLEILLFLESIGRCQSEIEAEARSELSRRRHLVPSRRRSETDFDFSALVEDPKTQGCAIGILVCELAWCSSTIRSLFTLIRVQ